MLGGNIPLLRDADRLQQRFGVVAEFLVRTRAFMFSATKVQIGFMIATDIADAVFSDFRKASGAHENVAIGEPMQILPVSSNANA